LIASTAASLAISATSSRCLSVRAQLDKKGLTRLAQPASSASASPTGLCWTVWWLSVDRLLALARIPLVLPCTFAPSCLPLKNQTGAPPEESRRNPRHRQRRRPHLRTRPGAFACASTASAPGFKRRHEGTT
jgi:hypothetical protein